MADDIDIHIPWLRYDIALPLIQGRVPIDGVRLIPDRSAPAGTVFRGETPLRTGDFGLVDLNMVNWLPAMEAGWELIGLPVFPKRKHLYTYLFCRAHDGITGPKDLEGRRVFATVTGSAVAIWLKTLLEERHGVNLDSITWVSAFEQWPIHGARWKVEPFREKKNAVDVLADRVADAVMVDISDHRLFAALESDPRFARVVPDYMAETRRAMADSMGYLPVHMIAMSRKLDRAHPELAGKLVAAFKASQRMAYDDILDDRSGFGLFDLRERFIDQTRNWGDLFPQGLAANRAMLEKFAARLHAYGVIGKVPRFEDVLAASSLDS